MSLDILALSRVSSKFQITIPKAVRENFSVSPGQQVMFLRQKTERGYELILRVS